MRFLILILFLAGCGIPPESDTTNHGYGWQYDAESQHGLKLRKDNATVQDATFLEQIADSTSTCTGITTPPPSFVISVPTDSLRPFIGQYYSDPDLIVLDENWLMIAFKHELIHYLLHYQTGDPDYNHVSPLFQKCALG